MSSGTRANVGAASQMLGGIAPEVVNDGSGGAPMGMSNRQLELNHLWTYFRCLNYATRKVSWDGSEHVEHLEREAVVSAGFIPPGFYDAGQTFPLKFRRPDVPYYLAKVIVNRFTGLLFSKKRHPRISCPDDPRTEDWLLGFAEATRLWSRMHLARTYGGAMGSVGLGFVFKDGRPKVEVHDPRWCTPEFEDRDELIVSRFEKRYQYPKELRGPDGEWYQGWFWYRRVIDDQSDTVWPAVPVEDNEEPNWESERSISTPHGFGFCPLVWCQNTEVQDDIDGDPDCWGAYDMIESIDQLSSQAKRGVLANCDPTTVISSDGEFDEIRKGSDNALKLGKGESANYLELNGTGPKAAQEMADRLEQKVLRQARCVLEDNFGGPAKTEEEVQANFSAMIEQADVLREQYGEKGVKRLLEMVLKAARILDIPQIEMSESGKRYVKSKIKLPRNKETKAERQVGQGEFLELNWPDYYEPSLDKIGKAVTAAGQAKQFGLIDDEHATQFVANYFQIEDVKAVIEKAKQAQAEMADAFVEQVAGAARGGARPPQPPKMPAGMRG